MFCPNRAREPFPNCCAFWLTRRWSRSGQSFYRRKPMNVAPTAPVIKPLAIPGQVLYPRTVRALIFILPITLSVGLFVQGISGSSQSPMRSGTASHTDNSSQRSNQWLPRLAFWRSIGPGRSQERIPPACISSKSPTNFGTDSRKFVLRLARPIVV